MNQKTIVYVNLDDAILEAARINREVDLRVLNNDYKSFDALQMIENGLIPSDDVYLEEAEEMLKTHGENYIHDYSDLPHIKVGK